MSKDFLEIVQSRGYVHQFSDAQGLADKLKSGMQSAYIGFDCTAPSLHAGSLVQIMLLRWFQKCGHKPIVLIGGGTTRVGDPSGKDAARQLLDDAGIARNIQGIASVFSKFVTFGDTGNGAQLINNADWLNTLNYIDFLRDVGRHFSVNRMLTMDSVKLRLEREQPLSFLEFNYMCLQAYDFVELYQRTGCILQMGGSDQWGNIVSGIDLGRRMAQAELYALTSPLLTNANGAKMGKTADGAVWLSSDMLSVYEYWQYWRNTLDADVVKFLKLFTELPLDEIARLGALQGSEINEAKKVLATEATAMLHGREAALLAEQTAKTTFEMGEVSADLPTVEVSAADIEQGLGVLNAFTMAGLVPSSSEARRQIKGGGLKLNDTTLSDERSILRAQDFIDGVAKLSMGKKKHVLLKLAS